MSYDMLGSAPAKVMLDKFNVSPYRDVMNLLTFFVP